MQMWLHHRKKEARKIKTHQDWGLKFDFWDFPSHSPSSGYFTESFTVSFSLDSPESSIADYKRRLKYTQQYKSSTNLAPLMKSHCQEKLSHSENLSTQQA